MKHIICTHWNINTPPRYINRLYGMVSRNIGLRGERKTGFITHLLHYILPTPWAADHRKE